MSLLSDIWDTLTAWVAVFVNGLVNPFVEYFNNAINDLWTAVDNAKKTIINTIYKTYNIVKEYITNVTKYVTEQIFNTYNTVKKTIINTIYNTYNIVKEYVTNVTKYVTEQILNTYNTIKNYVTNVTKYVTEQIYNTYNTTKNFITNVTKYVTENIYNTYNTVKNYVTNAITNVVNNIYNTYHTTKEYITNVIGASKEYVDNALASLDTVGFFKDPLDYIGAAFNKLIGPWINGVIKSFEEGLEEGLGTKEES